MIKSIQRTPQAKIWHQFGRNSSPITQKQSKKRSDAGTLKAIGIANAVKEGLNQNKENQQILAQATVEANNDKIEQLEKQQHNYYMQS